MKRYRDPCLDKPQKKILSMRQLDVIFRRRNLPNTTYEFTTRKHSLAKPGEAEALVRSFRIPMPQKLLSYIKYCDRNNKMAIKAHFAKPVIDKYNVRLEATRDRSRRLYIAEEPDTTLRTVVDLHPEFYLAVEGRPLRHHDDIKVYISNIRNYAMTRQQVGSRKDTLLKLEMDQDDERKEYKRIDLNFKFHLNNFRQFLTEDYKLSCAHVSRAEKLNEEVQEKVIEYVGYAVQLSMISDIIYNIESVRGVLKTYRSFLMFAAPLYWREQYDERYREYLDQGDSIILSERFSIDDDVMLGGETYIDKIVEACKIEFKNPALPHMYFKQPVEMQYLYRTMELQSREYLLQLSNTHVPYSMLQNCIKSLKDTTKRELDFSQFYIDMLQKEIERESANENYFQDKFMRILNETFYDTVASPATLKLEICLEFVYEKVYGKYEDGAGSIYDCMKLLETMYESYSLRLDGLEYESVTQASKECYQEDLLMMRAAQQARRVLHDFGIMTDAMNRAFQPPAKFKRPERKKFIDKKTLALMKKQAKAKKMLESGERIKRKEVKVTPEQRDDLLFFTNWCEGIDPTPFLQQIETYVAPMFLGTSARSSFEP